MNLMILSCSLHSLDLVILNAVTRATVRKISINAELEKMRELEFIPTQAERHLEYGKILDKVRELPMLDQGKDYSFTFEFYSNGTEHSKTDPVSGKLHDMYRIFITCNKKQGCSKGFI